MDQQAPQPVQQSLSQPTATPSGPKIILSEKKKPGYLVRIFSGRMNRQNFCIGSIVVLIVPLICLTVLLVNGLSLPTDTQLSTLNPYDLSYQQPTAASLSNLFVTPSNIVIAVIFLISLLVSTLYLIAFQIRRLHDLNQTGWLSLLCFIPMVSYAFGLYISLWTGSEGDNRYGPKPLPRTNLVEDILCFR